MISLYSFHNPIQVDVNKHLGFDVQSLFPLHMLHDLTQAYKEFVLFYGHMGKSVTLNSSDSPEVELAFIHALQSSELAVCKQNAALGKLFAVFTGKLSM